LHSNSGMKTIVVRGMTSKVEKPQYALRVSSGFNQGALVPLGRKRSILGRSFRACVPLEDDRVSREHAEIVTIDGKFFLRDMGSTNGSYLNNVLVDGKHELRVGDMIRVGNSVFKFETLKSKNAVTRQKWTNATSVIPRTSFQFGDLASVKPDRFLVARKKLRVAVRTYIHFKRIALREIQFYYIKGELGLTRLFHRAYKELISRKLIG